MTASWRSLAARVDTSVDRVFGELFRLVPWRVGELDLGERDLSRAVIEGTGVLFVGKEVESSLAGTVHGAGAQFEPRIITGDAGLSVSNAVLAGRMPQQGDHVHMLDPERKGSINEHFTVITALPDVSDRYMIDLVRARE